MVLNDGDRLESWKEIAAFIRRDGRTAYRWASERGMPVHHVPGGKRGRVFASRAEIARWLEGSSPEALKLRSSEAEAQRQQQPPTATATARSFGSKPGAQDDNALRSSEAETQRQRQTSTATPTATATATAGSFAPTPGAQDDTGQGSSEADTLLPRRRLFVGLAASLLAIALVGVWQLHGKTDAALPAFSSVRQITNDGVQKSGLVTDGSHVYFTELKDGGAALVKASVQSGEITPIESALNELIPLDISQDGQRLLVRLGIYPAGIGQLWIVPVHGKPQQVSTLLCQSAAWAADGHSIFYSSGKGIYLTADDGQSSKLIADFSLVPRDLRLSSDGSHLQFLLCEENRESCSPWQLPLSGSADVATALSFSVPNCCVDWTASSASGDAFLLSGGSPQKVWAVSQRHSQSQAVSLPPSVPGVATLASRNDHLFFMSNTPDQTELLRFDPLAKSYSPFLPGVSAQFVDFSADGQWITYVATDHALWKSRADGSDATLLRSGYGDLDVELPRWSPDGRQIAFMATKDGRPYRIYLIASNGGEAHEASEGEESQGAPTWSPDAKSLVYADVRCVEARSCEIHRIDLATRKVDTLPGSAGLRTARWSPDGRSIAALDPMEHTIRLFDLRTQRWRTVAEVVGDDLAWSRDSRYLYAHGQTPRGLGILRFSVASGRAETVVELNTLNRLYGSIYNWFGLTPDGAIILDRHLQSSEIFEAER